MSQPTTLPRKLAVAAIAAALVSIALLPTALAQSSPGRVIVEVAPGVQPNAAARNAARTHGGQIAHVYEHALRGYSLEVGPAAIARVQRALQRNPRVANVEVDLPMEEFAQTTPTGVARIDAPSSASSGQTSDIDIAIIDSGIDGSHPDLNVFRGRNFASGPSDKWGDGSGHGTHVAGTAAALDNGIGVVGVAPGARLWAVRVLGNNGSGWLSDIIAGIDYVTANADEIEVANMSLGGTGVSSSYRTAIRNCVEAGVIMFVAAGNEERDVYGADGVLGTSDDTVPAAYPEASTISALSDTDGQPGGNGPLNSYGGSDRNNDGVDDGADDSFAFFSNFSSNVVASNPVNSPGAAIDLVLPGVDILSTVPGGYDEYSGTSMASPHAAGLGALYILERRNLDTDGDGVADKWDADGDGTATAGDVYALRQELIDAGKAQTSSDGLAVLNDPDGQLENLGWSNSQPTTVSITPSSASGQGFAGEIVTYDYTVTNDGSSSDTFALSASAGWATTLDTSSLTLGAGSSGTVTVSHEIPAAAEPGTSDAGTITATSSNNGSTATAGFTTSVQGYAVDLSPSSQSSTAAAGDSVTYTYTVANTGTEPDTWTLQISGNTWNGSVSPTSVSPAPGASTDVTVTHDVPSGASSGASDLGTLSVTSADTSTPATSDSASFETSCASVLTLTDLNPSSVNAGNSTTATASGTGFASGATVAFENGSGPAPEATGVTVIDSSTIDFTITTKSGGPPRQRTFDLRVTNPDGGTAVLPNALTINP